MNIKQKFEKFWITLKRLRLILSYFIVILTILVFIYFIKQNPEIIDQLKKTNILTILEILALYMVMTGLLAVLYQVMTIICKVKVPVKENLLLTMYSSIVNFFGPLQSGPGFRTVYLKKKYNINIPAYVGVSLLYYLCFGVMSGLLLLSGLFGAWLWLIVGIVAIAGYITLPLVLRHQKVNKIIKAVVPGKMLLNLILLSILQVLQVSIIYFIELKSVNASISFNQALIYTGAANFALFVSLTPGALGFRESFLIFSQDLHKVDRSVIISTNIIDRGIYLLFLGFLFIFLITFHGWSKFKIKK